MSDYEQIVLQLAAAKAQGLPADYIAAIQREADALKPPAPIDDKKPA